MTTRSRWTAGYRILGSLRSTSASAPLYAFTILAGGSLLGLAHEAGLRQPAAYLDPIESPPRWVATAGAGAGLALGAALATAARGRDTSRAVPLAASLSSLVATASGLLWCVGFRGWLGALAIGVPTLGCALAAFTLGLIWRGVGRYAVQLGMFEWALSPFRLFGTALVLGLAAVASAHIGLIRSGAILGLTLAIVAAWWPRLLNWLEWRPLPSRWQLTLAAAGMSAGVLTLAGAEALVPLRDLRRFPGEVVFTATTPRSHYVLTSAQDAFALFRDGHLELSTVDDYRYAEALAHPALALAGARERVALLGGGKGMVEREILRWPDVAEVTVVTEDAAFSALTDDFRWWRSRSGGALASARVELIEAEPIVWLDKARERWDVILVDVPDPSSYEEAKSYTRLFYELVRARLRPRGVVVVQATSPFRSPVTFASVEETLRAAGFTTLPYRAPIPTLGEWGFVLASLQPLAPPRQVPPGTRFLDRAVLDELFARPADLAGRAPAIVNRMNDMRLLDVFERESPE